MDNLNAVITKHQDFVINNKEKYITLPIKLKTAISKMSFKELRIIDSDINVAKEKLYLFLSFLPSNISDKAFKSLHSWILISIFGNYKGKRCYITIVDLLYSKKFIAVDINYVKGKKSTGYGIGKKYVSRNSRYNIKTKFMTDYIMKRRRVLVREALKNPIARNNFIVQAMVVLPTKEELMIEGKRLVEAGETNKGKPYTMLHGRKPKRWKDHKERSFIEENIKSFENLTQPFKIPTVGDERSGGRVVCGFTLAPSWCRKLIKIRVGNTEAQEIVEKDYSCLHPNIIAMLYGESEPTITHKVVADYLEIDIKEAKIENLSFFNKKVRVMKQSPLWKYYTEKHPVMMENLIEEKYINEGIDKEDGHKETSKKLFAVETNLMTEAVKRLNREGVFVIYVYDCLYTDKYDASIVKKTMNKVAKEMGINTKVG